MKPNIRIKTSQIYEHCKAHGLRFCGENFKVFNDFPYMVIEKREIRVDKTSQTCRNSYLKHRTLLQRPFYGIIMAYLFIKIQKT